MNKRCMIIAIFLTVGHFVDMHGIFRKAYYSVKAAFKKATKLRSKRGHPKERSPGQGFRSSHRQFFTECSVIRRPVTAPRWMWSGYPLLSRQRQQALSFIAEYGSKKQTIFEDIFQNVFVPLKATDSEDYSKKLQSVQVAIKKLTKIFLDLNSKQVTEIVAKLKDSIEKINTEESGQLGLNKYVTACAQFLIGLPQDAFDIMFKKAQQWLSKEQKANFANIEDVRKLFQKDVHSIQMPVAMTAAQEGESNVAFWPFVPFVKNILATYHIQDSSDYFNSLDNEQKLEAMMNWLVGTVLYMVTSYCVSEQTKKYQEEKSKSWWNQFKAWFLRDGSATGVED